MDPIAPEPDAPGVPGDAAGFRLVFEAHRDRVHRLLTSLARHAHDADDLLQETFLTAWRKRALQRGAGSVGGWLRRIAYRTYLNARPRIERERRRLAAAVVEPVAHDAGVGERLDAERRLARVRALVDALPDDWREALVLFRFEGLSCAEIADLLGVTPKAVERRLARALEAVTRRAHERHADGGPVPLPSPRGAP